MPTRRLSPPRPAAAVFGWLAAALASLIMSVSPLFGQQTPPAAPPNAPRTILFFGDSLSAGYGLANAAEEAFPALIQRKLTDARLNYRVVNAGLSGDTSAGGLRRIDWLLQHPVDLLVLELGGNDGLRGLPTQETERNLQAIIDKTRAKNPGVKIVIAGMRLPPNLGVDYVARFIAVFPALAKHNPDAVLLPFILEGVGGDPRLNQRDQIHPTAEGHKVIAELVWQTLKPLL